MNGNTFDTKVILLQCVFFSSNSLEIKLFIYVFGSERCELWVGQLRSLERYCQQTKPLLRALLRESLLLALRRCPEKFISNLSGNQGWAPSIISWFTVLAPSLPGYNSLKNQLAIYPAYNQKEFKNKEKCEGGELKWIFFFKELQFLTLKI